MIAIIPANAAPDEPAAALRRARSSRIERSIRYRGDIRVPTKAGLTAKATPQFLRET
jgi:hypothetical protein